MAFSAVANAVNYLTIANRDTLNGPAIVAEGSDTNIDLNLAAKNGGSVKLRAGGSGVYGTKQILTATSVASPVNYATVTNSATGTPVIYGAYGTDASVSINIVPSGSGVVQIKGAEACRRTSQTVFGGAVTIGSNGDYVVFISNTGAPVLPTAVGNTGKYTFKNIDSATRTVSTTSSQTIDGSATLAILAGDSVDVISDGTNWRII